MLNATIVKLRNENSKMYAEMEDLKAVTINGLVLTHSLIYIKKKEVMHGVLIVYIIRLLNIVIFTHTYYMCKILKMYRRTHRRSTET